MLPACPRWPSKASEKPTATFLQVSWQIRRSIRTGLASGDPDLIVAATAERYSLIVLHYDGGYQRIAQITGQPAEWIVPRGTADGNS